MCGRFAISLPKEAMTELFKATPANDLPKTPNYNVCPTNNIHTVTSDKGIRHLRAMRWGFVPSWYATLSGGTPSDKCPVRNHCQKTSISRCLQKSQMLNTGGWVL